MQMRATGKRLALAFLAALFAVGLVFGARSGMNGGGGEKAEAAPPFPFVRVLAPDLYEFFIDGDGTTSANVAPANGLQVNEILAGDQSATLGGDLDFYPDFPETILMEAFGASDTPVLTPPQINATKGSAAMLPDMSGSLAVAVHIDQAPFPVGHNTANIVFSGGGPGVTMYAEAASPALLIPGGPPGGTHGMGPVDPTLATTTCGSALQYFFAIPGPADFPDGDCDGVVNGPMDYNPDTDGDCVGVPLGVPPTLCSVSGGLNEDDINGLDDDGDLAIDEDPNVNVGFCIGMPPPPAPQQNDPLCREDSLAIAHLMLLGAPAGPAVVGITQGADVGGAPYDVRGDVAAFVPIQEPDCDIAATPIPCTPDPLTIGGTAPACPINLDSGGEILTWDAVAPIDSTLGMALMTPVDASGPITRVPITWSSNDNTIAEVQEPQTTSFNIPAAFPVPLAGVVGANLLCSNGSTGTATITASGSGSINFDVNVNDVLALRLDFDISDGACVDIDASATVGVGDQVEVGVCFSNPLGASPLSAFQYRVLYNDTIVLAPEVPTAGTSLDDNPDANVGASDFITIPYPNNLGTGWDCNPVAGADPKGDEDGVVNGTGSAFSGGCGSPGGPNTLIQGPLGVITFDAMALGSTSLTISQASTTDDSPAEVGSCNPTVDVAMLCEGGDIDVVPPPPTNTPTVTNTATHTPTATNTPEGLVIIKDPDQANLWLCEDNPDTVPVECLGPGEGDLQIDEVALNIPVPLGGWEIQVKFDHKIFNIEVDPNESLFTDTDQDGVNPPDNDRVPDCGIQIVTENWILFGCVSTGDPDAGYTGGPAVLATLNITPNEDLKFRLHPGNDNGVVRMILDENCELADTLGHPMPGSINGGLTGICGDAAITVRILEGDLNLDCEVNMQDQQLIAGRYGTFFGNIFYDPWYDLEPALKDFDIDIKDLQKVFGRDGSDCQNPIPDQDPAEGLSVGPL